MVPSDRLRSGLNALQFELRNRFWGRFKLRGAPHSELAVGHDVPLYRKLLKDLFTQEEPDFDILYDIGCRDWSYVKALAEKFPKSYLIGVEVDGYRRYWNLHRRMDIALLNSQSLDTKDSRKASCYFGDFRKITISHTASTQKPLFVFFFPFVSFNPCLKWGLPMAYANFKNLLLHAQVLSSKKTETISFHQGDWEAQAATGAYKALGFKTQIKIFPTAELASVSQFPYPIYRIHATRQSLK